MLLDMRIRIVSCKSKKLRTNVSTSDSHTDFTSRQHCIHTHTRTHTSVLTNKQQRGIVSPSGPKLSPNSFCNTLRLTALWLLNSPTGSPRCRLPWIALSGSQGNHVGRRKRVPSSIGVYCCNLHQTHASTHTGRENALFDTCIGCCCLDFASLADRGDVSCGPEALIFLPNTSKMHMKHRCS